MAEGIMGLAPGMGAPAAPQQAPQQPDPRGMQAFMDAASQMDSDEVEGQLDEALAEMDPALVQQIQAELSAIQITAEQKQLLMDMINYVLSNPQDYAQIRIQGIEAGLPEELLPEDFNVEFFATLRYVVMRLPVQEAEQPVQNFRNGGAVSLKPVAKFLAAQGRGGDTMLAHINPREAEMLRRMGGAGTINPVTGLREYKSLRETVTKPFRAVGRAISKITKPIINVTKKLLANPIVRTVATVGLAVAFPPAAALGMTAGTVASAAVNYGLSTAGVSLLAGEKPKDALKQGLMAGALAGGVSYATGANLTGSTRDIGMGQTSVRDFIGKGVDAINPFSSSTPAVTADTEFAKLTSKGLPADAQTYRLATEAADKANKFTVLGMDTPTAIMTLGPPALSLLAPDVPPTPEDLDMPGVGGPTGMDLLEGDPGKYGVEIGGTSSAYTDPYAGIETRTPINIGSTDPNAPTSMPGTAPGTMPPIGAAPSTGFAPVSPNMPAGDQYNQMFAGYDPTKDPMSPLYNPFATTTPPPAPFTGGVNVAQGFAKGGIATLQPVQKFSKGGTPKKTDARMRQEAAQERKRMEALSGSTSNYLSTYGPSTSKSYQAVYGGSNTQQKSQAQLAREREAALAAAERTRQKTLAEQQKRVASAVAAAQKAGQEGRSFEFAPGYANERDMYRQAIEASRQSSPMQFMTPAEAEAYVARQRSQNLAAERASFEKNQAEAIALANRNAAALAEKQRAEKELADFEAYKASILGPGASTQPITPGGGGTLPVAPPADITLGGGGANPTGDMSTPGLPGIPVTPPAAQPVIPPANIYLGGGGANPTGDMSNTGLPGPSAPVVPEINIGAGAPAVSPAVVVYGPDGTQYGSPAAAITAGVFNYSMTPPAAAGIGSLAMPTMSVPSVDFGSAPAISPVNVPSAFGTGSTAGFGSGSTAGAFGSGSTADAFGTQPQTQSFAAGGIAAMAPYKFKSGSKPVQHFPRRTGPINGPGTGTSDSIPAMLSDGEFVFTAKAVRGMGNGSRLAGAKKMYKMMKMLEGKS